MRKQTIVISVLSIIVIVTLAFIIFQNKQLTKYELKQKKTLENISLSIEHMSAALSDKDKTLNYLVAFEYASQAKALSSTLPPDSKESKLIAKYTSEFILDMRTKIYNKEEIKNEETVIKLLKELSKNLNDQKTADKLILEIKK